MTIAASEVVIDGQVGIEDFQFPECLNLVKWIERSRLCSHKSLVFEPGLLSTNPLEVRIIRYEALDVDFIAG